MLLDVSRKGIREVEGPLILDITLLGSQYPQSSFTSTILTARRRGDLAFGSVLSASSVNQVAANLQCHERLCVNFGLALVG